MHSLLPLMYVDILAVVGFTKVVFFFYIFEFITQTFYNTNCFWWSPAVRVIQASLSLGSSLRKVAAGLTVSLKSW